ncbi:MAG: 50S ribosomal protein L29 [Hyphomicrobiales bacterium]|nr:50S ribosomal protein L29 [Hyphomicrobiales bacterium]
MNASELRSKTQDELNTLLNNAKKELFNLRFQKTTGELGNTARVRTVRRTIAKINTVLPEIIAAGGPVAAAPAKKEGKNEARKPAKKVASAEKKPAKKAPAKKTTKAGDK